MGNGHAAVELDPAGAVPMQGHTASLTAAGAELEIQHGVGGHGVDHGCTVAVD
jgi:hypothetical protein